MAVSPYVTGQLLPDVLLAPAFQDAIAKSRTAQFTGLGGLSAPKHQRASQVLTETIRTKSRRATFALHGLHEWKRLIGVQNQD